MRAWGALTAARVYPSRLRLRAVGARSSQPGQCCVHSTVTYCVRLLYWHALSEVARRTAWIDTRARVLMVRPAARENTIAPCQAARATTLTACIAPSSASGRAAREAHVRVNTRGVVTGRAQWPAACALLHGACKGCARGRALTAVSAASAAPRTSRAQPNMQLGQRRTSAQ